MSKNDFAYVLQFFSLISDGLGSVCKLPIALRTIYEKSHSEKPETFEVEVDIERIINKCSGQSYSNGSSRSHATLK